jgi:hypothetical protein
MELMLALKARMLQYEGILIYEPSLIEEMEERFGDRLDAGIEEVVTAACRLGIFDPLYFEYDILTGPQIRDIYASMRAASLLPEEEED